MRNEIKELNAEQYLNAARERILNEAAMASAYDEWPDDFARISIDKAWKDSGDHPWERRIPLDELRALDSETLHSLGFKMWDEKLRLIPLWAWNYIEDGCELVSVDGDKKIKGSDGIDLEVRFGAIAWGFTTE